MKKEYVSPLIICEKFQADEYVAACGDSGTVYKFKCNAGKKGVSYAIKDSKGRVATISGKYMDGGSISGSFFDPIIGSAYFPCNITHEAESDSGFLTGYHLDDPWTKDDENISVIIWTENNTNVHCTTNLDMSTWETTKS